METLTTADRVFLATTWATTLGLLLLVVLLLIYIALYVCGLLTEDRKKHLFESFEACAVLTLIMVVVSATTYPFSSL